MVCDSEGKFDRRAFLGGTIAVSALTLMGFGTAACSQELIEAVGEQKVKDIEHFWVPMPDGTRLAARAWIPESAEQKPVPVLLEYIPYRKRDSTRINDEMNHPFLASHGYACIRVDTRGNGDSEGITRDEYSLQEQDDAVHIINWLSEQAWSTGNVGMFGISWGGFSALQAAAKNPSALKAIITHCSTDDRYTDDAHYMGGAIINDMFVWGSVWMTHSLGAPDPEYVGEDWLDIWKNRLEKMEFFPAEWLKNQHKNDLWKSGSISENYDAIKCGVYAVGGWVDSYSTAIPRMLENLSCPRKGLIGPWGHYIPHIGSPGSPIGWLKEALRWWDHWLKGKETGIMDESMYRVWMQDEVPLPGPSHLDVPGRWVAEDNWPSNNISKTTWYLNADGLEKHAAVETAMSEVSPQTVGLNSPNWLPFDFAAELPDDQRMDDGRSMTFDSEVLVADFEILGAPVVNLELAVDKPVAFVAIRLNEVDPSGFSSRITYHVRNLTHRNSHENPEAMIPEKRYNVTVPLHDCAHKFKKGNRVRISISTTYWPLVWPSPESAKLTVFAGKSSLMLPVRIARKEDAKLAKFGKAFVPETSAITIVENSEEGKPDHESSGGNKKFDWNVAEQTLTITGGGATGVMRLDATGTEMAAEWQDITKIVDDDPLSASLEMSRANIYRRGEWDTKSESVLKFSATKKDFLVSGEIKAFNNGEQIFFKKWDQKITRKLV